MVLSDIGRGPRYGYQILQSLRAHTDGRVAIKAGTLYPILHKLERDGCVQATWDDSAGRDRKWYTLTEKGRQRLAASAREWLDYAACVRSMLRPGTGDAPGTPVAGAET